jgi:hypothetical protein
MKWLAPSFILVLSAVGLMVARDTPLMGILPVLGFCGGCILWTRIAYLVIAISGLTSNPGQPSKDSVAQEKVARRVVLGMAATWLLIVGCTISSFLKHGKTGFALLFGGLLVVPALTVTHFFIAVRQHRQRAAALTPHD